MTTTELDLTIEIRSENGSRTQFYQDDRESISKIFRLLIKPRLFTRPFLMLASELSVSAIPSRTIDIVLVRTALTLPLPLPPGWLEIVEVGVEKFHSGVASHAADDAGGEDLLAEETTSFVEIHTSGGSKIVLKLQTTFQATVQDRRQRLADFFDLPVIPFHLETGGIGFINPAKISRVTVYPAFKGVAETALPVDFLRCI